MKNLLKNEEKTLDTISNVILGLQFSITKKKSNILLYILHKSIPFIDSDAVSGMVVCLLENKYIEIIYLKIKRNPSQMNIRRVLVEYNILLEIQIKQRENKNEKLE